MGAVCTPQRVIAALVFVSMLAYLFAPFHDADASFPLRLIFWAGVMGLAIGASWFAGKLVRDHLYQHAVLIRDIAFALLILTMFAPSLWLLSFLLFTASGLNAPGLWTVVPYGVVFATGLVLVRQHETAPKAEEPSQPRLYKRLHEGFSGQIYRLSVRDHLVDVVTSEGTFTIRSRFTDAISDMEPLIGHCTHRSHWVAEAAISGVEKQGGRTMLRLCNGDLIPVSRNYRPNLEQAGLV